MRQPTGAAEHEATMKSKLHAPTFAVTVKTQRRQTVKEYLEEWSHHLGGILPQIPQAKIARGPEIPVKSRFPGPLALETL